MTKTNNLTVIQEHQIYDVYKILPNFNEYFGLRVDDVENMLNNYTTITLEEVLNYIEENLDKMEGKHYNKETLIDTRTEEYNYYKEVLLILKEKGLTYIELLKYLNNLADLKERNNYKKQYEDLLNKCNINHYYNIIVGRDLNRILIALSNTIEKFIDILDKINNLATYNRQNIDSFALKSKIEAIYPRKDIIPVETNSKQDKTSLQTTTTSYFRVKKINS